MPRPAAFATHAPVAGTWAMLGVVLGCALQLQQPRLWAAAWYVVCVVFSFCGMLALLWRPAWRSKGASLLLGSVLALGTTGWRASEMAQQAMPVQWEGRDVQLVGVIDDMPQSVERGVRMRFHVEQAYAPGATQQLLALPRTIALTWYGPQPEPALQAGQRWHWTVRLKAPHGTRNPHGMDWERWMWTQGVQAIGYVRHGERDAAPQWLAQTWQAPVAQWRGHLLAAMEPPAQASAQLRDAYGVVQALVTGAQSRMSAADWALFRDTGVAHLVSISGLHITICA